MANNNKFLAIGGITVLLASIVGYGYYQYNLAMKYCYKLYNLKILKISNDLVRFNVQLKLRNFSSLSATITSFKLSISINDVKVTDVISTKKQMIKADSTSDISFDIEFSPKKVFNIQDATKILVQIATNKDMLKIKTNGFLDVSSYGFSFKNIPIDITMTLKEMMENDPNALICDIK